MPTMRERWFHQRCGRAIVAATGTVQRAPRRPPQSATSAAAGRRTPSGIHWATPALSARRAIQSRQRSGRRRTVGSATAAVTARAIPSGRHSRRAANQMSATPHVGFVRRTIAQSAGYRNAAAIAAARTRLTFAKWRSRATNGIPAIASE